jgi:hypothetical protein
MRRLTYDPAELTRPREGLARFNPKNTIVAE